jgi:hypothetical protein
MKPVTFGQTYIPEESERTKPQRISIWFRPSRLIVFLIVIAVVLAVIMALTQESGVLWLFEMKEIQMDELGEIAEVLAPLFALALAIERILETVFDLFEQAVTEVAELGNAGLKGLQWFQDELDRAWEVAREAADALGQPGTDEETTLKKLKKAEQRIIEANRRIAGLTKDPKYVATKRMLAIWIGLLLGLIVAILSDLGVFELLQISVPRILDILVTGFVVGAGSGPMHSLVGILQGTKETMENLGGLASLGPIKQQISELQDQLG